MTTVREFVHAMSSLDLDAVVVVAVAGPSFGATRAVGVESVSRGIDWDGGRVIVRTEKPVFLESANPEAIPMLVEVVRAASGKPCSCHRATLNDPCVTCWALNALAKWEGAAPRKDQNPSSKTPVTIKQKSSGACDVFWDGPGTEEVQRALEEAGIRDPALSELLFLEGITLHLVRDTIKKTRAEGGRGGVLIKAIRQACAAECKRREDKRKRDDERQRKRESEDAQRRDAQRHRRDVDAYIDALDGAELERAKQDVLTDLDPRLRKMVECKDPRKSRILKEKIYAKSQKNGQENAQAKTA